MKFFSRPILFSIAGGFAAVVVSLAGYEWLAAEDVVSSERFKTEESNTVADADNVSLATFGNGCFWCTEAVFQNVRGVSKVVSGYMGGKIKNPTYKEVCAGVTGHAEVVQLTYDPEEVAYTELLEAFWNTHDPTTLNQQGNDVGTQYRSAVFYHTDEQRRQAEEYKEQLDKSGAFKNPIVTEITPADTFYPAEDYHQDYYELNGREPYCQMIVRPKVEKFKKQYANLLVGVTKQAVVGEEEKIMKTEAEWKAQLTPEQYQVTRKKGTERAHTGEYWNNKREGMYRCVCCGEPLFESDTKFDSGTGWPSFFKPVEDDAVAEESDRGFFMTRTEVLCRKCDAHLGHVFDDGPKPTGLRYCINSASLEFEPAAEDQKRDAE